MGVCSDDKNNQYKTDKMKTKSTKKTAIVAKKKAKKKIVLTTLAVSAAGIFGYFGWQYYKKQKDKKSAEQEPVLIPKNISTPPYQPTQSDTAWSIPKVKTKPKTKAFPADNNNEDATNAAATFPLRRGSKGAQVKALQEALIEKHGRTIMPKYGADGFFGAELIAALKKLKLPATITETTYHVLVHGQSEIKNSIAQNLYNAASKADFKTALSLLKKMNSKDDYQEVSKAFTNFRLNGVRQTLVNGMLNSFPKEEQKQAIRFEFIRMGLQYDGTKWSLSGLGGLPVITNQETTVWLNASNGINVPPKTVLGNEISKRLDYTLFENKGKYFLVRTNATNYL